MCIRDSLFVVVEVAKNIPILVFPGFEVVVVVVVVVPVEVGGGNVVLAVFLDESDDFVVVVDVFIDFAVGTFVVAIFGFDTVVVVAGASVGIVVKVFDGDTDAVSSVLITLPPGLVVCF